MKPEIVAFLKRVCKRFNLRAVYISDVRDMNDLYSITTPQGMALMTFTTAIFYHIPPRERERMIEPTLKRGLNQLMGERDVQRTSRLYQHRRMGKIVV